MRFDAAVSLLCLALSTAGGLNSAQGQTPTPPPPPPAPKEAPELAALRQQYMAKALTAAHTLSDQYMHALENLEKDAAQNGDYEQALNAQRRRQEIADEYKAVLGDLPPSNAIVLRPNDVKNSNGVVYDKNADTLGGWRKVGSSAEWELFKLTPGEYQVTLVYAVGDGTTPQPHVAVNTPKPTPGVAPVPVDNTGGGEFEFYEDSTLIGADANHRTGTVDSTKGWTTYANLNLEPIHLQRTSGRLVLRCTKVKGGGGLMCLKEIRLTPVTPAAAKVPEIVGAAGDEVSLLVQNQLSRVKAIAQPLSDNYLAALAGLEKSLSPQQDTDALAALTAERSRVQKWLENPATPTPARSSAFRSALNAAGMSVVAEDARFVPDATNAGDRFRVTMDGKEQIVRLMWITCPPVNADDKADVAYHAKYFGITPEDTEAVGREAQDFSASLLADKPLRILSSGQRDKDQHLFAMVVAEGMEDLASVLVDNGLAAVNPSPERKPASRRYETTVLKALKERELAARQRPIPPGAWAYTTAPTPATKVAPATPRS